MERRIRLLDGINFSWSLLPDSVQYGEEYGDDNIDLSQMMTPTPTPANSPSHKHQQGRTVSTIDSTKIVMILSDKKTPLPALDVGRITSTGCSRAFFDEAKLEDQDIGFSPLFDDKGKYISKI